MQAMAPRERPPGGGFGRGAGLRVALPEGEAAGVIVADRAST